MGTGHCRFADLNFPIKEHPPTLLMKCMHRNELYRGRGPSLGPRPSFIFGFERAWYAKIRHLTSFWTSVGVSMETPPFTMTSFQSAYGQVAAWCEYSSSETDGRIAS